MDNRQFEDLAKALAGGAPRRQILKGLLGGAFGSALAVVGLRERAAAAVPKCRPNQKLCNGRCISASGCCVDISCVAQCVAGCFGFNGSFGFNGTFASNQSFTFNHQAGCEKRCIAICSSGNCP